MLVDTGVPDGPILARLKQAGIDRLDALMLTHAESDHEGAAAQVIAHHRPRLIVDGGAGWDSPTQRVLAARPASLHAPAQGETITLGRLTFQVLWPPQRPPGWRAAAIRTTTRWSRGSRPRGSRCCSPPTPSRHVLLPLQPEPVDILKVRHHGSADPDLPTLLQRIRPKLAAIEVGAENTYGHPAPSTLAALTQAKATVIRTDRDGTTVIHADDGRVTRE